MKSAQVEIANVISKIVFIEPKCFIYQNIDGLPTKDIVILKEKLIKQIVSPVMWTHTIQNMIQDNINVFVECGPGKVLQGLVKKISPNVNVDHISDF
jgi:[acyl-carrier-protein] S-malonyltransferase